MATPYQDVYDAFLVTITDDEWSELADAVILSDWRAILESAIPFFKFPRIALTRDDTGFINDLTSSEIGVLAIYMKKQWLSRNLTSWDKIKSFYSESDFSKANILDKLTNLQKLATTDAENLEHTYYRSVDGKPYNYGRLAGSGY